MLTSRLRPRRSSSPRSAASVGSRTGASSSTIVVAPGAPQPEKITMFQTRGFFYPLAPSGRLAKLCRAHIYDTRSDLGPVVNVSQAFANPRNVETHSATVVFGNYRYYVVGYFDATLDANLNLRTVSPHIVWRGEIGIFSLGKRVRVKARPTGTRAVMEEAIRMFIEACTNARLYDHPLPRQLVALNGAAYDTGY